MKVFRFAALAWAAAAGLYLFSLSYQAQEGEAAAPETQGEAEAAIVELKYDVRGLTRAELGIQPANGGIGDVLAPDHLFGNLFTDHELDAWTLRDSGDEARCWDTNGEVLYSLIEFCNINGDPCEVISRDRGNPVQVVVRTTEDLHKRLAWGLEALREVARARVSLQVYRLPAGSEASSGVLTAAQAAAAAKTARLVGTLRGGLAERMVLQRVQHQSYLADYQMSVATGSAVAQSDVRDLRTGEEIVAGAIVLPDGKLWIQGWHAAMRLAEMQQFETNCGRVELPRVSYSYTPLASVLPRACGTVLDAGPGNRFLVIADCDAAIKSRTLKPNAGTTLSLMNVTGCLRGMAPVTGWLMTPNRMEVMGDGISFDQVFVEQPIDGPYNDAAAFMKEYLEGRQSSDWFQFQVVGPFLGIRGFAPVDDEEMMKEFNSHAALVATDLEVALSEPAQTTIRVRAWVVSPGEGLPAGIVDGAPSERDMATMVALGQPVLDRTTTALGGQRMDFLDLAMAAHVRDYQTMVAQQAAGMDPVIGTLVTGKQVRWNARSLEAGLVRFELRAALTVGDDKFENIPWGDERKWSVQRSKSDLSQLEMISELAVGGRSATVSPGAGAEGSLIVLVAERVR